MRLLPKSIHRCHRYPTKFNSGRDIPVNRSSLYYEPVEPDAEQLALMRRMDELHLKHPFFRQPHDDADAQS